MEDDYIYPPELLGSIDFDKEHLTTYDPQISFPNPEPNLLVRPLRRSDYNRGAVCDVTNLIVHIYEGIFLPPTRKMNNASMQLTRLCSPATYLTAT